MTLLYLFMLLMFFGYISYIIKNYGVQSSISASYYVLPKGKYWFTYATMGYAFPAAILSVLLVNSVWMFLTGCLLGFVAIAYDFRNGQLNNKVHMISAKVAVLLSQIGLIFDFHMWYISLIGILLAASLFLFPKFKNKVWWQETILIIMLFIAIGIKLFL